MDHNLLISILDFKGLSIQNLFLKILTLLGPPGDSLSSSHMAVVYISEAAPLEGATEECEGRILSLFVLELTDWLIPFI